MTNKNDGLNRLVKYIEENIRVSDQTTIQYIDPRGHIQRLNSKQNQVIFGRRGSGKSLLLRSLKSQHYGYGIFIKVNLEDFKDVSFPNSLLQVLTQFFEQLKVEIRKSYSWYEFRKGYNAKNLILKIDQLIKSAQGRIKVPDTYEE